MAQSHYVRIITQANLQFPMQNYLVIIPKKYCSGNQQIYMAELAKNMFQASFSRQRVLIKDPTVWLDGARPPQRYIYKYMKIKIAESYINDIQFGYRTIQ